MKKTETFIIQSECIARHCKSRRINFTSCNTIEDAQVKLRKLVCEFHKNDEVKKLGLGDIVPLHKLYIFNILDSIPKMEIVNPGGSNSSADIKKSYLPENYNSWIEKLQESVLADIYITSINAITLKGEILSGDDMGNQIAGIIFGPRKVIIVVGKNMIYDNLETAFKKTRGLSSVIFYGAMEGFKDRVHVILVDEELKPLEDSIISDKNPEEY